MVKDHAIPFQLRLSVPNLMLLYRRELVFKRKYPDLSQYISYGIDGKQRHSIRGRWNEVTEYCR